MVCEMARPSSPEDELIDLRCPRCVRNQKNGLLGRILKRKLDLIVQGAIGSTSLELLADVILHCDNCNIDVVYCLAVLSSAPAS